MIVKRLVCRKDADRFELARVKEYIGMHGMLLVQQGWDFIATFDSGIEYISFLISSEFAGIAEESEFGLSGTHNTRRIQ